MQQTSISGKSIPITEEMIKELTCWRWGYGEGVIMPTNMKWALVRVSTELRSTPILLINNCASTEYGLTRMIKYMREINSDPNHELCNKLTIVSNPYL
jgi:hypothetical protein